MFDNLLYQDAGILLAQDFLSETMPQAILLSGPVASGKLTAALELARIVSCQVKGKEKGMWSCTCPSCLKHKALVHPDLLLVGSRDCTLEIAAASQTLIKAASTGEHLTAARYLFLRSVRKLTARFNPVLLEGDPKTSKIEPLIVSISEMLEEIELQHQLPSVDKLQKKLDKLAVKVEKLETGFMYDSLPISQIRKASMWAHYTVSDSKKVFIIENVDRMQEGVRNAFLKILEEPPTDTMFILTTARRSAVMPTILSRVRTYNFAERTRDQQLEVIKRVFHAENSNLPSESYALKHVTQNDAIELFLNGFLPVTPEKIAECASNFIATIHSRRVPDIDAIVKEMKNFEPRIMLKMFFNEILINHKMMINTITDSSAQASWQEVGSKLLKTLQKAYSDVIMYNQSTASALEQVVYVFLEEGLL